MSDHWQAPDDKCRVNIPYTIPGYAPQIFVPAVVGHRFYGSWLEVFSRKILTNEKSRANKIGEIIQ